MELLEQQDLPAEDLAKARFVFDDLGHLNTDTLKTHSIPWKVAMTAVVIYESDRHAAEMDIGTAKNVLKGFGFIWPTSIPNWEFYSTSFNGVKPLGMVSGLIARDLPRIRLEVANLSCASCHAGRLYDQNGNATDNVWLGLPNTSLNLDAYVNYLYESLKYAVQDDDRLLKTIPGLFPSVSEAELKTIEKFGLPEARERIEEIQASSNKPLRFDNGGPGVTNGIAALKMKLDLLPVSAETIEHGYTAIPRLSHVSLRSSLLYDGSYAIPGTQRFIERRPGDDSRSHRNSLADITGYFTVPTQGGTTESAIKAMPRIREIFDFLGSYTAPPFPGDIDYDLAEQGAIVYQKHCAACHGSYTGDVKQQVLISLPNRFSALEDINTDPARARAMTPSLVKTINSSKAGKFIDAKNTNGYIAPVLTGLWATAPYLHNGSVPTLWHLFNPRERPEIFQVGGHRLDYRLLGIAGRVDQQGIYGYEPGYAPFAEPDLYDTKFPGKSNRGHEAPFSDLSEADKNSLLEYLKLL